jgi:threonine dehydrogenase-like Zn-dependent dehydrogenase
MKAIVWDKELRYVDDYPVPVPPEGEVLVRMRMAGICNTDLEITKGYMGFTGVLGHEFVGTVEKIGEPFSHLAGKRVVGEINCVCGKCAYCLGDMKTHCPGRTTLGISNRDGAFAEYMTIPVENLLEVPHNIPDEDAVFTEPLAAAFEITDQVHIKPTDRILVMGDGKLGLLSAFVLSLTQARVTLTGKHEDKLKIARDRRIEAVTLESVSEDRVYDVVIEATGTAEGITQALSLVKPRGTIVLKSTVAESKEINLTPVVVDEIKVVGSRCGPFEPVLRALSTGLIDVKPLITATYPIEKAMEAFEKAKDKNSLKVLISF